MPQHQLTNDLTDAPPHHFQRSSVFAEDVVSRSAPHPAVAATFHEEGLLRPDQLLLLGYPIVVKSSCVQVATAQKNDGGSPAEMSSWIQLEVSCFWPNHGSKQVSVMTMRRFLPGPKHIILSCIGFNHSGCKILRADNIGATGCSSDATRLPPGMLTRSPPPTQRQRVCQAGDILSAMQQLGHAVISACHPSNSFLLLILT